MSDNELFNQIIDMQGEMISNLSQLVFQYMHTPDEDICKMLKKGNATLRERIAEAKSELKSRGVLAKELGHD